MDLAKNVVPSLGHKGFSTWLNSRRFGLLGGSWGSVTTHNLPYDPACHPLRWPYACYRNSM